MIKKKLDEPGWFEGLIFISEIGPKRKSGTSQEAHFSKY